jgi:hypothetical protein
MSGSYRSDESLPAAGRRLSDEEREMVRTFFGVGVAADTRHHHSRFTGIRGPLVEDLGYVAGRRHVGPGGKPQVPDPSAPTDAEVLTRWLKEPDADGAITLTVFRRYRDTIRQALQECGLSPRRAVELVAEVLVRARSARPETTLRDRLLASAREVVDDASAA